MNLLVFKSHCGALPLGAASVLCMWWQAGKGRFTRRPEDAAAAWPLTMPSELCISGHADEVEACA